MVNDEIIRNFYNVISMYGFNYGTDGVLRNLSLWEKNKGPLVDMLRNHPDWDEDNLGIVFNVTESREIDDALVFMLANDLCKLKNELSQDDYSSFYFAIQKCVAPLSNHIVSVHDAQDISSITGIKCVARQKTSRVINKICAKYGVDKHDEYNSRFASLADALNPLSIQRKAVLSVNPCDYLTMSLGNSWSSCQNIASGGYKTGTLSYMNDSVSMIFYTLPDDSELDYHRIRKLTREVFCYGDGILLQSRLYPETNNIAIMDHYRQIVQMAISTCLESPNLWELKRDYSSVSLFFKTRAGSSHYPDYAYAVYHPTVSLLKPVTECREGQIIIGNVAYCIVCGENPISGEYLSCCSCSDSDSYVEYVTCYQCGLDLDSEDAEIVDGEYYCPDCCSLCDDCGEYYVGDGYDTTDHNGNTITVCPYCYDDHYCECDGCGDSVHNDDCYYTDDGSFCSHCFRDRYDICSHCGDYIPIGDGNEIGGHIYCNHCAESMFIKCEICGEYIPNGHESILDGKVACGYCEHCQIEENWKNREYELSV